MQRPGATANLAERIAVLRRLVRSNRDVHVRQRAQALLLVCLGAVKGSVGTRLSCPSPAEQAVLPALSGCPSYCESTSRESQNLYRSRCLYAARLLSKIRPILH